MSAEEQLGFEARWRPRAAVAAGLAGLLPLAAIVVEQTALRGSPQQTRKLTRAGTERLDRDQLLFLHQHVGGSVGVAVLVAISGLAVAGALWFLFRITRARRPVLPALLGVIPVVGGIGLAIVQIAGQALLVSRASSFARTPGHPPAIAYDLLHSGALPGIGTASIVVQLLIGVAFVLVSINAIRVGLLTRPMGYVGALVGVLNVLPLVPSSIVQFFWFAALTVLLLGRWPNGMPAAWRTGEAEPWPSVAEAREQRLRERTGRPDSGRQRAAGRNGGEPPPPPPPAVPEPAGATGRTKRNRKKRR